MSEPITFAFLREGTSDEGLVPHLRELIVRAGAPASTGSSRDYKGSAEERLRLVEAEDANVHIVFVHRDADGVDAEPRREEVLRAATKISLPAVIPVVPIQELEAWLLLDEMAIRQVVGRPSGKTPLSLPHVAAIERTARPKEILETACLTASETTGRRRQRELREFSRRRRTLLERLNIDGPVRGLSSSGPLQSRECAGRGVRRAADQAAVRASRTSAGR